MAAPVRDLPAPDSPTTPSTSPGSMDKEIPSTATSVPRRVAVAIFETDSDDVLLARIADDLTS